MYLSALRISSDLSPSITSLKQLVKLLLNFFDHPFVSGGTEEQCIAMMVNFDAFEKQPESARLWHFNAAVDFLFVSIWL